MLHSTLWLECTARRRVSLSFVSSESSLTLDSSRFCLVSRRTCRCLPPFSSIVSGTNLSVRFSSTLDDRAHLRSGVSVTRTCPILASKSVDLSISVCRRPSSALSFLLLSLRLTSLKFELSSPRSKKRRLPSCAGMWFDDAKKPSLFLIRPTVTRFAKQVSGKIDRQMSTGRLRSVKLARLHAGVGMRDESRTLDFRLKFVPTGKEELENLRFIPAVNVTEKPQLENAPSVKLVTETVKFSQTGPFILRDGLVAVGAKVDLRSGHLSRGLRTCVPCRIHVTRFAFLLCKSWCGDRDEHKRSGRGRRPTPASIQLLGARPPPLTTQLQRKLGSAVAKSRYSAFQAALARGCTARWRISRRQATAQRERAGRSVLRSKHRAWQNRNVCSITERPSLRSAQWMLR